MLKLTLLAVLTVSLAACNTPPAEPVQPTPPPAPELVTCPSTIAIRDFAFEPANCQVAPGTIPTFTNYDSPQHNATTTAGAAAAFATPDLDEGESAPVTLAAAGQHPYECTIHPGMTGSITVQQAAHTEKAHP